MDLLMFESHVILLNDFINLNVGIYHLNGYFKLGEKYFERRIAKFFITVAPEPKMSSLRSNFA